MGEDDDSVGSAQRLARLPGQVLYGVAYYAEYQPYDRLERDLDLMAEAGLTVIRVGESVWSTWEPEDGRFELDWLQPVLDGAHARGIQAILGTPTYADRRPGCVRKHPEVTAERAHRAARSPTGIGRTSTTRIRRSAGTPSAHHAQGGRALRRPPGGHRLPGRQRARHRAVPQPRRVRRLRRRAARAATATSTTLNERWGLVYWSHRIARWDELWPPDGNTVPSYDLAWRRYQSELTHGLHRLAGRASCASCARPDQFVDDVHGALAPRLRPGRPQSRTLDIAAVNPYYAMQDGAGDAGGATPSPRRSRLAWTGGSGAWAISSAADLTRGRAQAPFLVTETNALSIGESHAELPGLRRAVAPGGVGAGRARRADGRVLALAHAPLRQRDVLGRRARPRRRARPHLRRGAADRRRARSASAPALDGLRPRRRRRLLLLRREQVGDGVPAAARRPTAAWIADPRLLRAHLRRFYEGCSTPGVAGRTSSRRQQLSTTDARGVAARWPVLVAPALYIADDALLDAAARPTRRPAGTSCSASARGYADEEARRPPRGDAGRGCARRPAPLPRVHEPRAARPGDAPAPGATAAGAAHGVGGRAVPEDAETLARYDAPAPRALGGGHDPRARRRAASPTSARCPTGRSPWRSRAGCGRRRTPGRTARTR